MRDTDVLGEGERRLAVEQRVIDDLGSPSQFVFVEPTVRSEDLERGLIVNVLTAAKRLDQGVIVRQMGEDPQLNLRIVRRNQDTAGLCDERASNLSADRGPNRDVLQIGIAGAQAPGGRDRLIE